MIARFGSLVVVDVTGPRGGQIVCQCDCGNVRTFPRHKLERGYYVSCGCRKAAQQAVIAKWTQKHGAARAGMHTRTYRIWQGMLNRCRNKNQKLYHRYGGRGISVDPLWNDFSIFLADMGEAPAGKTLDRVDNNSNYTKSNCRWATLVEQRRNSSQIVPITILGRTMFSWEWAEVLGVTMRRVHTMWRQVKRGVRTEIDFIRGGAPK